MMLLQWLIDLLVDFKDQGLVTQIGFLITILMIVLGIRASSKKGCSSGKRA